MCDRRPCSHESGIKGGTSPKKQQIKQRKPTGSESPGPSTEDYALNDSQQHQCPLGYYSVVQIKRFKIFFVNYHNVNPFLWWWYFSSIIFQAKCLWLKKLSSNSFCLFAHSITREKHGTQLYDMFYTRGDPCICRFGDYQSFPGTIKPGKIIIQGPLHVTTLMKGSQLAIGDFVSLEVRRGKEREKLFGGSITGAQLHLPCCRNNFQE